MAPIFHVDVDWLTEEAVALSAGSTATPRRPLVVGGSGLLGTNLVVLLAQIPGCEWVRVLDLRKPHDGVSKSAAHVEFVEHRLGWADSSSDEEVKEEEEALLSALEGVDCVFSVVTPHVQHASEADFYATNDVGVKRLITACEKKGVSRLVHLSSIAVTSHFQDSVNQSEAEPLPTPDEYVSPYDISKRRGEDAVLNANEAGKLATCSLRAGGIFLSPGDFTMANFWPIIPGVILAPYGEKIDFIDGRDVCTAMLRAAQALQESPKSVAGEAFFITKGESWVPGEVGKYGAKCLGAHFIHVPDWVINITVALLWVVFVIKQFLGLSSPGIPPHQFIKMIFHEMTFDNSKAHKALGWLPKIKVVDSVDRIVSLYIHERGMHSRGNRLFPHLKILVLVLSMTHCILRFHASFIT